VLGVWLVTLGVVVWQVFQARQVQALEEKEHPFKVGNKLTAIELRSITKTPVPES
jgi:hypothetical protein